MHAAKLSKHLRRFAESNDTAATRACPIFQKETLDAVTQLSPQEVLDSTLVALKRSHANTTAAVNDVENVFEPYSELVGGHFVWTQWFGVIFRALPYWAGQRISLHFFNKRNKLLTARHDELYSIIKAMHKMKDEQTKMLIRLDEAANQ